MTENLTTEKIGRLLLLFADPVHLRVLSLILDEDLAPTEIAARSMLNLAATMRHLRALQQAGLVKTVVAGETRYRATLDQLKRTAIELATSSRDPETASVGDVSVDTREVLSAFFAGSQLKALPLRNRRKKMIVLEELLRRIPWKAEYKEAELDAHIKPIYEDYCSVRRAWVDFMYMVRNDGVYTWTRHGMDAIE
ncbi:DUF2087 domain-containing protein [Massilia rubra]|uniref:DUF2087 domain-containing protein n=1 Tax=Massilia rubra TaxID=2607910 RepID=A0ABX0LPW7_9BURK|nr:DUF2087 domain-containing protein [Massilia rubra]NHZ36779.1 DUF2087 domain-containing protein [Massilia rubra]